MKTVLSIITLSFLVACGSSKKIEVAQIRKLQIKYDENQNISYGSKIQAKVIAELLDGSEHDVTDHKLLSVTSGDLKKIDDGFQLKKIPNSFDDDKILVSLTMSDDKETFTMSDSIVMNFKGDLLIDLSGKDGENGIDQKNRSLGRIVIKEGKTGENGTDGTSGSAVSSYTAHIWTENGMRYLHLSNEDGSLVAKYKSDSLGIIRFDLSGGDGGKGGDGGDGGDGKGGKIKDDKIVDPGNGGPGGNGGNGGTGGQGGSLNLFLLTDDAELAGSIQVDVKGGLGGTAGLHGSGGDAGAAVAGSSIATKGNDGTNGVAGSNGSNGEFSGVQLTNFNIEELK